MKLTRSGISRVVRPAVGATSLLVGCWTFPFGFGPGSVILIIHFCLSVPFTTNVYDLIERRRRGGVYVRKVISKTKT